MGGGRKRSSLLKAAERLKSRGSAVDSANVVSEGSSSPSDGSPMKGVATGLRQSRLSVVNSECVDSSEEDGSCAVVAAGVEDNDSEEEEEEEESEEEDVDDDEEDA